MDVRHQKRTTIIQELYAYSFNPHGEMSTFNAKTLDIIKKQHTLNQEIEKFASKFPIDKIAKVDVAILQLSIYDLIIEKQEPPKVIINEAVELAKELGSDRSFAFINAILGKIYEEYKLKFQQSNAK